VVLELNSTDGLNAVTGLMSTRHSWRLWGS